MGKFSGTLLVSDIDGTLLRGDHTIGLATIEAIVHFQAEGGRFTLATGRMPSSLGQFLDRIQLNAPAICYNGAAIYDYHSGQTMWQRNLATGAGEVVDHVERHFPNTGIEVYQGSGIHFCKINDQIREHVKIEGFTITESDWRQIPEPWTKALFVQPAADTEILKSQLLASRFALKYQFVRSSSEYFELLPQGASKGQALLELCRLIGQDIRHTIAVGDNDNDVEMLKTAGLGVAVDNASPSVKDQADHITVHHEEDAIHRIIQDLDQGIIKL
jgi:Cof subfamily protein (haloacid dehalogenase superfamily)